MTDSIQNMPELLARLKELGCLEPGELRTTRDGFFAVTRSLADMLACRGITTVPTRRGEELECRLFFDDWYLFALSREGGYLYSLFKMREQEQDKKMGRVADGDTPGVTVPFITMDTAVLLRCLTDPTPEHRCDLNEEINRVVAYRGQTHHPGLKDYFIRTRARAPYLIALLYTDFIASLAVEGELPVPEKYAADYREQGRRGRVPAFLEENNREAGVTVCDHEKLYIRDPLRPTRQERMAILATHTGNVSLYSFAAEVRFHARFLTPWARIPIPGLGRSVYDSAIRADMSIDDGEFTGPTPYYRLNSRGVKAQQRCHGDWAEQVLGGEESLEAVL